MLMHHLLLQSAQRTPDRPAFTWVDRQLSLSHAQAVAAMQDMAGALTSLGVGKGDRVAIVAHNGMDYLLAMLGAWRIGAIAALVNVRFADELDYYFADSTPTVVIYTHDLGPAVRAAAASAGSVQHLVCMDGPQDGALSLPELLKAGLQPGPDPQDESAIAHLSYTSGTTGKPKGACLAHEPTVRAVRCIAERLRLRPTDVSFGPTALSSSYQLVGNLLPCMALGASAQVMGKWTPSAGWEAMDACGATQLVGNPTLLQDVLEQSVQRGRAPKGLRLGLSGGGPVPNTLKKAWRDQLGLPLVESFGQSELGGFMALGYPELEFDDAKLGRVGPPLPDKEVWIAGPQGQRLPCQQVGEIILRGGFMRGYWNKPEATASTIGGAGGDLLQTGDLGCMDADGFITMRGRRSEVFLVNGQTWFARDVEESLCNQPGIRQAAMVGIPDAVLGTQPIAFVTLLDDQAATPINLSAVKQQLEAALGTDLGALRIEVVQALPMTPTGKIAKAELCHSVLEKRSFSGHTGAPLSP